MLRTPIDFLNLREQLKYTYSGLYSYRLNKKDRLVFLFLEEELIFQIIECKDHYQ